MRGFDRNHPFLQAVRQDPVLGRLKLIAEPWDVGPGGYQLGAFPAPFLEWNDKFRDQVRRYWRGDRDMTRKLAMRISGSALKILASYWWPGNIRELENLIERLVAVTDTSRLTPFSIMVTP